MYNPSQLANVIRSVAKSNGISIGDMLKSCDLGVNTMSNLNHGKSIAFDSLAKIADYLEVSVDYLLGREENPELKYDPTINQVAEAFSKLSFSDKTKVMSLIAELSEKNDK